MCRTVCRANRYLGCLATEYETNTRVKLTNDEHAAILQRRSTKTNLSHQQKIECVNNNITIYQCYLKSLLPVLIIFHFDLKPWIAWTQSSRFCRYFKIIMMKFQFILLNSSTSVSLLVHRHRQCDYAMCWQLDSTLNFRQRGIVKIFFVSHAFSGLCVFGCFSRCLHKFTSVTVRVTQSQWILGAVSVLVICAIHLYSTAPLYPGSMESVLYHCYRLAYLNWNKNRQTERERQLNKMIKLIMSHLCVLFPFS